MHFQWLRPGRLLQLVLNKIRLVHGRIIIPQQIFSMAPEIEFLILTHRLNLDLMPTMVSSSFQFSLSVSFLYYLCSICELFPGMQHEGYQNSFNGSVLSNRFYAPPPPPPRPPPPVSFIKPTNYNYSEPPLPPGTSELPPTSTVDSRSVGFSPIQPPPGPLLLPPLPPLFPYLSPKLAQSLHDGATQCGTSFVEESNNLPFIPVIIDDTDLKKMTESVKTQFEETRQQNLLLYEDIIDPSWPKELRDMFQPLYCKLCKLTVSCQQVVQLYS